MESDMFIISVIVPVYNPGKYLIDCLNSLIHQTIDKKSIEVLLIDDGSTDDSYGVCKLYSDIFPFIHVYHKDNNGVGSARNYGIDIAKGKYILFLDSDDSLANNTLESVVSFFDEVYEDVDLVTYKLVSYLDGKRLQDNARYKYVNKSGVYYLDEIPYFAQTTMNIVVKNNGHKFDENIYIAEDQLFISECLLKKNRIGYCDKGEYRYSKNSLGTMGTRSYAYYMFEQKTEVFERLLTNYPNSKYLQGLVLGNYSWMLKSDCVFPYHYKGKEWETAENRIKGIIDFIDIDMIANAPDMDPFHKHFWLSLKRNAVPTVICENDKISVFLNDRKVYCKDGFEIVINKVNVQKSSFEIIGFIKSPVFNYTDVKPELIVTINDKKYDSKVFESINSCYKSETKTNMFWGFRFKHLITELIEYKCAFKVGFDGFIYDSYFYLGDSSGLRNEKHSIKRGEYLISADVNTIIFSPLENENDSELIPVKMGDDFIRTSVDQMNKEGRKVWLYCDSANIGTDNAYLQFIHDWDKVDGVDRYYVYMGDITSIYSNFSDDQKVKLVPYGSDIHKILYLVSEYVICSFFDLRPRCPFTNAEYLRYLDIQQPRIIYLGHGVLHADLRYTMSAERCKVDKVVVSTHLEEKILVEDYHYNPDELIVSGAPRFDFLDKTREAHNRILYAPSWRKYLSDRYHGNVISNYELLKESVYFSRIMDMIKSPRLRKILDENDLYLDVKLHPNAMCALSEFNLSDERVSFLSEKPDLNTYKLFISDISSYVYDFAYLERPIIYYVPDLDMIESGMHTYRKLHIPLEQGFGPLTQNIDDFIRELNNIVVDGFRINDIYLERIKKCYLDLHNCRDSLYDSLISLEKNS